MKYLVMYRGRPVLRTNDIREARACIEQHPYSYIHYGRRAREEYMASHPGYRGEHE